MFRTASLAIALIVAVIAGLVLVWPGPSLPDFSRYEAGAERKEAFFAYLRPVVASVNSGIAEDRERLLKIAGKASPGFLERRWLQSQAKRYELATDLGLDQTIEALEERMDTIPESLALAQAAMESGWGTSRFARDGNNLFGEWCFRPGCGLVPAQRAEGRNHEVRRFRSPLASIESYVLNINSHNAYRELRQLRADARDAGRQASGYELAAGLFRYSEKGAVYVDDIRAVIAGNDLE